VGLQPAEARSGTFVPPLAGACQDHPSVSRSRSFARIGADVHVTKEVWGLMPLVTIEGADTSSGEKRHVPQARIYDGCPRARGMR
jgi:hypothetical protein